MCGPTTAETSQQAQMSSLATQLQSNYGTLFGEQQGVLSELNNSLSPIVTAGPSQSGFSGAQLSALQTSAINASGGAAASAEQAARTFGAGEGGGGTSGMTSGITKQIEAGIASQQAGQLAGTENQIALANAQQGQQNYWRAVGGQQALASAYNPSGAASGAISAGGTAFSEASQIQQQQQQEDAAIAGGIASLATNIAAPGIGGAMGGGGMQGFLQGISA